MPVLLGVCVPVCSFVFFWFFDKAAANLTAQISFSSSSAAYFMHKVRSLSGKNMTFP